MNQKLTVTLENPDHLKAHLGDLYFSLDELVRIIKEKIGKTDFISGEFLRAFRLDRPAGLTGLKLIESKEEGDFWGYRRDRQILSHLIIGEKQETYNLCIWGFWVRPEEFRLHTCYPGLPAPREIHDPLLTPPEMKEAVEFWSRHAIIVSEGDYTL